MTAHEEIERLNAHITSIEAQIRFLRQHADVIDTLGLKPQAFGNCCIDFNNPSRDVLLAGLKAFGGDWEKEAMDGGTVNYSQMINGLSIRFFSAPPPPNCRLEEEEVLIPAQPSRIEKRLKLVCK
jgi:hypothetical protein